MRVAMQTSTNIREIIKDIEHDWNTRTEREALGRRQLPKIGGEKSMRIWNSTMLSQETGKCLMMWYIEMFRSPEQTCEYQDTWE